MDLHTYGTMDNNTLVYHLKGILLMQQVKIHPNELNISHTILIAISARTQILPFLSPTTRQSIGSYLNTQTKLTLCSTIQSANMSTSPLRPKKNMCIYGPPTDPNFWPRP